MDYKEKYEMALETIQEILDSGEDSIKMSRLKLRLQSVFPELKESEDERIRKALIFYLGDMPENAELRNGITNRDVFAWLEKQGEKPQGKSALEAIKEEKVDNANKVEPKFHEGDWVVYKNDICQIVKREEGCNKLVTVFGIEKELVNERNLSTARLWTIQDAKDGDVLAEGCIFIVRKLGDNLHAAKTYFTLYDDGDFDNGTILNFDADAIKPATKEQRDLLFSKMREAGYEWDEEKKELKKIEQKPKFVAKKEVTGKLKEMVDELNSVDLEKDVEVNGDSLTFHNLTAEEICCLIGHLTNMRLPNTFNQPAFRNDDWDSMDVPYCTQVLDLLKEIRDKLSKVHDKIPEQVPFFPYERYFPPTEPLKPYYNSETGKNPDDHNVKITSKPTFGDGE